MQGHVEDALDHGCRQGLASRWAGGILKKPLHARLRIATAPAPHGQSARAEATGHLAGAQAFDRQQNNPSLPDYLLRCVAIPCANAGRLSPSPWPRRVVQPGTDIGAVSQISLL